MVPLVLIGLQTAVAGGFTVGMVEVLKGSLSHQNCADPSAFERAQYMKAIANVY